MGRLTKLNEEVYTKTIALIQQGLTDWEIANVIGVHENTIHNWRKKNIQFLWSSNEAKLKADSMVEASLFHKAIGFRCTEERVFQHKEKTFKERVMKQYPPDTQAARFWLKNRKPKEWKDRVEVGAEPSGKLVVIAGERRIKFDI